MLHFMLQLNCFNKYIRQANEEQNLLFEEQSLGVPTTACVVPHLLEILDSRLYQISTKAFSLGHSMVNISRSVGTGENSRGPLPQLILLLYLTWSYLEE